jgi:LacI family transcriptional regulator
VGGKVGLREVAEASGVSLATVSRVFNQHPNVREEVRRKVLSAARRLDYSAHKGNRRDHVTVLIEGMSDIGRSGYQSELLGALVSQLADAGLRPDVLPVESADLELVGGQYTLATVAVVWDKALRRKVAKMKQAPAILVNEYEEGWHTVLTNHRQGMEDATKSLAERGHRRICLLRFFEGSWADRERFAGYCQGIAGFGIPYDPDLQVAFNVVPRPESLPKVKGLIKKLLKAEPTAIIVCTEDLALPAAHAIRECGKSIPDEVSLVTFENPAASAYQVPPLTTINQNPTRIAAAVTKLVEDLAGATDVPPQRIDLPNDFIERASVKDL